MNERVGTPLGQQAQVEVHVPVRDFNAAEVKDFLKKRTYHFTYFPELGYRVRTSRKSYRIEWDYIDCELLLTVAQQVMSSPLEVISTD